jgi:hypothetical protein
MKEGMKPHDWARRQSPAVLWYMTLFSLEERGFEAWPGSAFVRCDQALCEVIARDLNIAYGQVTVEEVAEAFYTLPAKQVYKLVRWCLENINTEIERKDWLAKRAYERSA